jgi:hypothetical protein
VGNGGWRWRRPDLQSITLRAYPNLKMEWRSRDWDVESGMMDELIALYLILIGIQTLEGIMDEIPPSLHLGDFSGAISLSRQWNESKKKLKQTLSVYPGEQSWIV